MIGSFCKNCGYHIASQKKPRAAQHIVSVVSLLNTELIPLVYLLVNIEFHSIKPLCLDIFVQVTTDTSANSYCHRICLWRIILNRNIHRISSEIESEETLECMLIIDYGWQRYRTAGGNGS